MLSCLLSSFFLLPCPRIEYLVCRCSCIRCDLVSFMFFFVTFLSSIVFHVSVFTHSSFRLFLYPTSVLLVSLSTWSKLYMFISCSSYSTWKRFFNSSLKAFSVFELFSFAVSNRCCLSSPRFVFRCFKDLVATANTCSLPMSAPRFALTSCSD